MRVRLFWRVLPIYLVVLSLLSMPVWQHNMETLKAAKAAASAQHTLETRLVASKSTAAQHEVVSGVPNRIILPRLNINVPVVTGSYNFDMNKWSVAPTTANYAPNTVIPNDSADKTLIYGHWTSQVFGPTQDLQPGDLAYVVTDNGHVLKYSYQYKEVIKPTDVQVFDEFKGKPGLVLMTCQGTWAQDRRMMFFNLVSAT